MPDIQFADTNWNDGRNTVRERLNLDERALNLDNASKFGSLSGADVIKIYSRPNNFIYIDAQKST